MTLAARDYWTQRFQEQGPAYVARGGRDASYIEQVEVLSPVLADLVRGKRVLDFGCGPGRFRAVLEVGREYVGVDIIEGLGTEPLGETLPDGFDTAVAVMVLQHITAEADYLHWTRELFRCLNPGGCLVVVDHKPQEGMVEHMRPRGIRALKNTAPWAKWWIYGWYADHWVGVLEKA